MVRPATAPLPCSAEDPEIGRGGVTGPQAGPWVAVLQPYLPGYRVPFFAQLEARLRAEGLGLKVFAPAPHGALEARRDGRDEGYSWYQQLPPARRVRVRGIEFRTYRAVRELRAADAIVVTLQATIWDAWPLLLWPPTAQRTILWGHVDNYVTDPPALDLACEKFLMRRSAGVFAYVDSGAEFAVAQGVPASKVTTLYNTIDVRALAAAFDDVMAEDVAARRQALGIEPHQRVFASVGALDEVKRVDFLAEALECLHRDGVSVKVLVAGEGTDAHLLEPAVRRGQVQRLGHADAEMKARILSVAEAIVNPGRIGLLAVDAMVAGKPIITTDYRFHGPEVEYLAEGHGLVRVPGGPAEFAAAMARGSFAACQGEPPLLSDMVENFAQGVLRVVRSKPER